MEKDKKKKKSQHPGLSTTTMVDMLFILLIFFVMVSTIRKDSIDIKSAKVKKDQQSASDENKKTEKHVLTIDGKNQIFIDGKEVKHAELQTMLGQIKEKVAKDTTPVIVLRPDALSKSSRLIEIFAILNEVGLSENVQIEVEKE